MLIKRFLERLLRPFAEARLRSASAGQVVILAYHNVVPDGWQPEGDESLHMELSRFRAHLDVLAACADVVPLDALFETPTTAPTRLRAAITFDDAYEGAVTLALPELHRRGLSSTVFCAPALFGQTFWWDRWLGALPGDEAAAFRTRALDDLQGRGLLIDEAARSRGLRPSAVSALLHATTDEVLRVACARGGVTLGSHSWDHPNLQTLRPDAAIESSLAETKRWLERFGAPVTRTVALPYGGYDPSLDAIAKRLGHDKLLLVDGGRMEASRARDAFVLPRLSVPSGLTPDGMLLRLSALFA